MSRLVRKPNVAAFGPRRVVKLNPRATPGEALYVRGIRRLARKVNWELEIFPTWSQLSPKSRREWENAAAKRKG